VQGVIAAAITPRTSEGDVNLGAAFDLIDFLGAAGVEGIALFTTHRDVCAIPPAERIRLVCLGRKRSRVPLLVGVGSTSLDVSAELTREARNAGAAAVLLPPIFDFPSGEDDLREFHIQFAAQAGSGIATFLSNVALECAIERMTGGRFGGVAVSGEDLAPWVSASAANRFSVLSANDGALASALASGVAGVISPLACAVPELVVSLDRATRAGNHREVERLDGLVREFRNWFASIPEVALLHAATSLRGMKIGPVPAPLSAARQQKLDEFREWFKGWLPAIKKLSANA
jgi:dihydrodipicolinate synthase/N-acetylneuraminate lyase